MENVFNTLAGIINPNTIKIDDLYNKAYRAYNNLSFDPEKRASQTVLDFEAELNSDCLNIPETERESYIKGYTSHLFAWLGAMSNCYSVMITGGSNFNNTRHEKANNRERAMSEKFVNWRDKALIRIEKNIENAKPQEQKNAEDLEIWKKQVDRLFKGWLVSRFKSRLETIARTGNVELVRSVLAYFSEQQKEKGIILAIHRNSIWQLTAVAEKFKASLESVKTTESTESIINGVRVVKNHLADRVQLFFDGRPEPEMIFKLKHSAFKWSPSNGCWQRQLTNNAIYAAERILK